MNVDTITNDTSFLPALVAVIPLGLAGLYKLSRLLKQDRSTDSLQNDEETFRKTLLEELERVKQENNQLLKERLDLTITNTRLELLIEQYKSANNQPSDS